VFVCNVFSSDINLSELQVCNSFTPHRGVCKIQKTCERFTAALPTKQLHQATTAAMNPGRASLAVASRRRAPSGHMTGQGLPALSASLLHLMGSLVPQVRCSRKE